METVRYTACGWKADMCRLFYVWSHVKDCFPNLEAYVFGKLYQDGCDSFDIRTLDDYTDASRTHSFLLVYQDCIEFDL